MEDLRERLVDWCPRFVPVCWSSHILHTSSDLWGRQLLAARVQLPLFAPGSVSG